MIYYLTNFLTFLWSYLTPPILLRLSLLRKKDLTWKISKKRSINHKSFRSQTSSFSTFSSLSFGIHLDIFSFSLVYDIEFVWNKLPSFPLYQVQILFLDTLLLELQSNSGRKIWLPVGARVPLTGVVIKFWCFTKPKPGILLTDSCKKTKIIMYIGTYLI